MNDEESDEEACPARRPCIENPCSAMPLDGDRQHETKSEEEAVSSSPSADDDPPCAKTVSREPLPQVGNRQCKRPAVEEEASSPPHLKSRRR